MFPSSLQRTAVTSARLKGLQQDLGMTGKLYLELQEIFLLFTSFP